MTYQKLLLPLLVALLGVTLVSGVAYAQSDEIVIGEGIDIGKALLVAGPAGAFAGILMSAIRVFGKNIKHEAGAKPDPKKFGLNILVGVAAAVVVGVTGVSKILGVEDGSLEIGTAFLLLYVVNQVIRPIYGNWIKGADATKKTD